MKLETKKYYDLKRTDTIDLKPGERRRRTSGGQSFNIKTGRESQKLDCVKIGPYQIERKLLNDNYRVTLPPRMRIHPIFHVSLLSQTDNPVSTEGVDIVNEYEVEAIVAKRRKKGRTEYTVLKKSSSLNKSRKQGLTTGNDVVKTGEAIVKGMEGECQFRASGGLLENQGLQFSQR
jgi:hypothetical protein